ncbi:MAG: Hpt domain-containing protein [Chloroflexi bacterium]|nr:Hpt domain-containing protein [Chloroflexota bacterium]
MLLEDVDLSAEPGTGTPLKNESWPIDAAFIYQTLGPDSEELLRDLIQIFLEDSPDITRNVRQALAADDRTALKSEAHTLKGSSASMGIITLADLCAELELLALTADKAALQASAQNLLAEYRRVVTALSGPETFYLG